MNSQQTDNSRRDEYIKAITTGDRDMLRRLEQERQGNVINISSLAEEDAYMMSIYKAVMSNDKGEADRLPEAVFVNGYESQLKGIF